MSPPPGPDARELSLMLADDIERVCEALNLDVARRSRRTLFCHSPRATHHSPKLEVEVWPKAGKWNDWIAGRYGDALGLVAYALFAEDPKDRAAIGKACGWAREYFGLADVDQGAWAKRREEAQARAARRHQAAARELSQARSTAFGLYLQAPPIEPGDAGWAYLLARGIDLAQLPRRPRAVHVSPAQNWYDDAGELAHVGPALLAPMNRRAKFMSLHRTWIDPLRPGEKADLPTPRKMWPESDGAAIPIWRGETGLSEAEALKAGVTEDMILCEGVEDGYSLALMTPELRVHAAGSLPGLLSYEPPRHVRRIIVAADNDWDKPQAQALLRRALTRLSGECGKAVSVSRSPEGKDFNDLLRGE